MAALNLPAHGAATITSHGLRAVNPSAERVSLILADVDGGEVEIIPEKPVIRHRHYEPERPD